MEHNTGGAVQYKQTQFETLGNLPKRCIQILLVKNRHHSDSENWWLHVVASEEDTHSEWQTIHSTRSLILSLLLVLSFTNTVPKQWKRRTHEILASCWVWSWSIASGGKNLTDALFFWVAQCFTIGIYWFPLIIRSPINILVQFTQVVADIY